MRAALMLVVARAASSLGSAATAFALNVWIYRETGSYAIFATLAVVTALPGLVFAPIAGALVDRYPRRRVLIAADVAGAVTILALLAAVEAGALTPWVVGAVTVTLALLRTLTWPAVAASIAVLAPPAQRTRVNGVAETLEGAIVVASPALGAVLFETFGLRGVALADVTSYLAGIAVVACIAFPPRAANVAAPPGNPWRRWVDDCLLGFRWIAGRRDLVRLLAFFSFVNLACSVFMAAYTPYVLSFATPATLATCLALGGTGTITGGALFAACGGPRRPETGVLAGAFGLGAAMTAFGIAREPFALYFCAFLYGAGLPLINASSQTIWQAQVPAGIQGRVFSIRRMIAWGLNPLSVLLSIPLVAAVFAPLLGNDEASTVFGHLWGSGLTGAVGLTVGACGTACALVAFVVFLCNGLRIDAGTPRTDTLSTV